MKGRMDGRGGGAGGGERIRRAVGGGYVNGGVGGVERGGQRRLRDAGGTRANEQDEKQLGVTGRIMYGRPREARIGSPARQRCLGRARAHGLMRARSHRRYVGRWRTLRLRAGLMIPPPASRLRLRLRLRLRAKYPAPAPAPSAPAAHGTFVRWGSDGARHMTAHGAEATRTWTEPGGT